MKGAMNMAKIGIIGGSGLDNPDILQNAEELLIQTPYGNCTMLKRGKIASVEVLLLARHGINHEIPPTQVNYRANIDALKRAGCTHILATTACGSLREEIERGDLVLIDQFIDFTRHRKITFHEEFLPHKMVHTPMAEPFSRPLREELMKSCQDLGIKHHKKGTVITIEGPRFSTKAESHMFRQWGADIINMSIAPEAILANEAGLPYAAIAMSTDYDCWKEDEAPVTWEGVIEIFKENVEKVTKLLLHVIPKIEKGSRDTDTIKSKIRTVPHWPKEGVMFRDITTLLKDSEAYNHMIDLLYDRYRNEHIEAVAGIESRGFIMGSALAHELKCGFVPIRKPGKLPAEKVSEEYDLEYGKDRIEIHKDAVNKNAKVLLVDDLIATGGTALAACNLLRKLGADVVECCFVVDLPDLGGKKRLEQAGFKVFNLVEFEGD
jgi:5'-methylthioadenosine phosphorylase